MRHYQIFDLLVEFKYIPLNKLGMLTGQDVRQKKHSELANLDIVKEHLTDAQTQLRAYRQTLKHKYGDILKLRTYTVLAIGFDCLLWEEVSEEVG